MVIPEFVHAVESRLKERNIPELVALCGSIATYLAHVPTERFADSFGTPRLIEDRFFRITRFLEEQLIPKENQ